MKIDVVLFTDDERYICIGRNKVSGDLMYALAHDVARGPKYAERYSWTRAEIEAGDEGPIEVEFSIEVESA